jgi:uncharacterized membrane protein (DUF485 family)
MSSQDPRDLTPVSGAPTDVAPVGRTGPKPAHELTADEERGNIDWEAIAAQEDFKKLLAAKARFIVPASIFFVVYYFALPILVGYATPFMETKIFGPVNIAYVFALSQFFMAWIIAALYVRAAGRFDKAADDILSKLPRK